MSDKSDKGAFYLQEILISYKLKHSVEGTRHGGEIYASHAAVARKRASVHTLFYD